MASWQAVDAAVWPVKVPSCSRRPVSDWGDPESDRDEAAALLRSPFITGLWSRIHGEDEDGGVGAPDWSVRMVWAWTSAIRPAKAVETVDPRPDKNASTWPLNQARAVGKKASICSIP